MEKRVYKNRIRVVFAYKMVTKAYWVEKLGMSKMKTLIPQHFDLTLFIST